MSDRAEPPISLGHAFLKRNRFEKLREYVRIFSEEGDRHRVWLANVAVTEKLMSLSYDILMLKCQYAHSQKTYFELYSQEQVFEAIFGLLEAASRAIYAHKEEDTEPDLSDFDWALNDLLRAIHKATGTVYKRRVPCPDSRNDHEVAYWDQFPGMLDRNVAKIIVSQEHAYRAPSLLSPRMKLTVEVPERVKIGMDDESL
ncbi:hypothetical protein AMS68_005990 [Peltaster fructicola]|uniref:Uncharacterized protein n=1 Tax=Peltaster fructicola TaxID=286661 RepID=A0A6H0Y0D6_9PEZI|nr:hypothetical protein AMS68_005990 [Peltaster fructicola]